MVLRFPQQPPKRNLLSIGTAVTAGLLLCVSGFCRAEETAPPDRPNILFILTDDQRWDAMSCAGHPFLETPNIDRIAEKGIRFRNAFVTTSLCSPSRASFLTGSYAHTHGVVTNDTNDPDPAFPTFPALLRESGYETAFIGKWHMAPTGEPRPGFDYWLSFHGQGTYFDPVLNENGREFKAEGYMTDLLTDYAVDWLSRPRDKPFCLVLSHKAVHGPFSPAPRHRDALGEVAMEMPASFQDTFERKPEWLRRAAVYGQRKAECMASRDLPVPDRVDPGEWNPRNPTWLNYYRTLLAVDESVGRVLDALDANGTLDSTVIVFAGDNGYFQGEHRRGDKRLFYEESIRIPFLVRYPPLVRGGSVEDRMVLNIDLAPTVLDLAGAAIPHSIEGRSLRPLLAGDEETSWRKSFLYEYFREGWLPGIPTMLGVRTERWKYTTYPDIEDIDELYDLRNDPHEMRNLAHDPAASGDLSRMRGELARLLRETQYPKGTQLGASPDLPALRENLPDRVVLEYTWEKDTQVESIDTSPAGNNGQIVGTSSVNGPKWRCRRFSGKDMVDVPPSDRLDPSLGPWTVEVWVRADAPDGVILAHGGESHGYALSIEDGKPVFTVRTDSIPKRITGGDSVVGKWVHLAGVIGTDGRARLYVNGEAADAILSGCYIGTNPHEGLSIGADVGTKVGTNDETPGFRGLMGPVRIYSGERTRDRIAADAE